LQGRSPDEILHLGYRFYPEVIHPTDYRTILKIHQAIVRYFLNSATRICDLAYVVFDFRLRGYQGKMMMSHKEAPLIVNQQVQMAVYSVASSEAKLRGICMPVTGTKTFVTNR